MTAQPTGRIRAARLQASPRLQRVLAALRDAGADGLTTREVIQRADVCAVSSCVDELNDPINGFSITSKRETGNVWRYRLNETQPVGGPNPGDSHPAPPQPTSPTTRPPEPTHAPEQITLHWD